MNPESAASIVARFAVRTPLVRLNLEDVDIRLKLENLQPIGAFKIRGAAVAMSRLPQDRLRAGVWTASAGNMGQAVAWCAKRMGVPCTVVVPDSAPETKTSAIERHGGVIRRAPFDKWWQAFEDREFPGVHGAFIHAFDDPDVLEGNATIGDEILDDFPEAECIYVPWGGGGLACGIAEAVKSRKASCRVIAAEVSTAAPLGPSLSAGRAVGVEYRPSFVDGIGGKGVFPAMLTRALRLVDEARSVTPDQIAAAVKLLAERNRVIAEGAGASGVACALQRPARAAVCVVSGGNINLAALTGILSTGRAPG